MATQFSRLGDMPKGCYVAQFSGRHIDEAIENANKSGMNLLGYYEQKPYGKSRFRTILVAYKKENEDENI